MEEVVLGEMRNNDLEEEDGENEEEEEERKPKCKEQRKSISQ